MSEILINESVNFKDVCSEKFHNFSDEFMHAITQTEEEKCNFENELNRLKDQIVNFGNTQLGFKSFLKKVSIAAVFYRWVRSLFIDPNWGMVFSEKACKLDKAKIMPYKDHIGNLVTLEYFMDRGHQEILENIREYHYWSFMEKEEIVQCYIQFSRSLSRETYGIIPAAYDPDRERVRNKFIKYEAFVEFIQNLSGRDSLIAKLIYFGAPSIDDVINLKKSSISFSTNEITFLDQIINYPKHMVKELEDFIATKFAEDLVFTNVRGECVDRAHLNHAFSRASEKLSSKIKITPGGLLKLNNEPT